MSSSAAATFARFGVIANYFWSDVRSVPENLNQEPHRHPLGRYDFERAKNAEKKKWFQGAINSAQGGLISLGTPELFSASHQDRREVRPGFGHLRQEPVVIAWRKSIGDF